MNDNSAAAPSVEVVGEGREALVALAEHNNVPVGWLENRMRVRLMLPKNAHKPGISRSAYLRDVASSRGTLFVRGLPGQTARMSDRSYTVASDGSYRRVRESS